MFPPPLTPIPASRRLWPGRAPHPLRHENHHRRVLGGAARYGGGGAGGCCAGGEKRGGPARGGGGGGRLRSEACAHLRATGGEDGGSAVRLRAFAAAPCAGFASRRAGRLWWTEVANVGVWRWIKNEPFLLSFWSFFPPFLEVRRRYQHAGRIQLAAAGLARRCRIPHPYSNRLNTGGRGKKKGERKTRGCFLLLYSRGVGGSMRS